MTYPQEPGAHGDILVDENDVVFPSAVQVLYQGLRHHVESPLRSQTVRAAQDNGDIMVKKKHPWYKHYCLCLRGSARADHIAHA